MKHLKTHTWALLLLSLIFAACDKFEGDVTIPSYLTINSISVTDTPSDSWSNEDGFFTSLIESAIVVIYVEGDTAETTLGFFQLPCRIPVLRNGNITRVNIYPVVCQDGIASKRIPYPFYESITLQNVNLTADSVTNLGDLTTHYKSRQNMTVHFHEFFEPGPAHIMLDSVVQRCTDPTIVRSGYGCGVVHIDADQSSVSFWASKLDTISNSLYNLYLEMDYWSDIDFTVGLNNPVTQDGSNQIYSHETIFGRPEQGWKKIYINIGELWANTYYYYPYIRLYFTLLNESGKSGNLYLDNIKLITI